MELMTGIKLRKTTHSRIKEVDFTNLEFGKWVTDHMLVCDFKNGTWDIPQILPYGNISLDPATLALHYGQTAFEGMKAFRMRDGRVSIFRIEKHYERFARTLDRMCMAIPPREIFIDGLARLIELDSSWVPSADGSSLYIRPFVYASEAKFGVKVSEEYRFMIFGGPVPEVYAKPIRVKVETEYIRAAKGGTGFAKCGGNYGGAFYPTQLARAQGYDQLLWTTGGENPTIEESGMMNVMFVIDGKLTTAPLSDSILDGVTRDSLLLLASEMGFPVVEETISVKQLKDAFVNGRITEAFGAGTAAVVAPIATIRIDDLNYDLPHYSKESIHQQIKQKLQRIRTGQEPDTHKWNFIV